MAAIDWDDVLEVAPDATATAALTAVPVPLRTLILAHVNGNGIDPDVFDGESGEDTARARQYLAAHMATILTSGVGGSAAVAGPIVSESEGGISRSYADHIAASGNTSELDRTAYGSVFKLMCRVNACGAWLA
jgi:hypothetical protein